MRTTAHLLSAQQCPKPRIIHRAETNVILSNWRLTIVHEIKPAQSAFWIARHGHIAGRVSMLQRGVQQEMDTLRSIRAGSPVHSETRQADAS